MIVASCEHFQCNGTYYSECPLQKEERTTYIASDYHSEVKSVNVRPTSSESR